MAHAIAEDAQVLKVHRARDGSVWYIRGEGEAIRSPLAATEFIAGPQAESCPRVRLLGTRENAALIARFYMLKAEGKVASVAVASPMLGRNAAERGDPRRMLGLMRECRRPASLGGYHEVTAADYPPYLLSAYVQRRPDSDPAMLRLGMAAMPLHRYLSFIPGIDWVAVGRVVADVLDPRWYVRADEPGDECDPRDVAKGGDREAARMHVFLGLDPLTFRSLDKRADTPYVARARRVLQAWRGESCPGDCESDPGHFLWRHRHAVERLYGLPAKADLAASKRFVDFLRMCWLDSIYQANFRRTPDAKPDGLFAPDHFFHQPAEAEAFRRHMAG